MIAVWLFLAMQGVCLQFVIVIFPDHAHLLFLRKCNAQVSTLASVMLKLFPFFALKSFIRFLKHEDRGAVRKRHNTELNVFIGYWHMGQY